MTSSDPEQIRAEIEETRLRLSDDVDTLADEANPKRIAQRQVDKTKSRLTNVKDRIMGSASDAVDAVSGKASDVASSAGDAVSGAKDRLGNAAGSASGVRESVQEKAEGNPLAAGLIAFGAGLLAASLFRSSKAEERLAGQAKERLQPMVEEAQNVAKDAASSLREPAQEAVQSVKETAGEGAQQVKETGSSAAEDVRDQAQQAKDEVQQSRQG
jgi:ElaB/YqjD/DUF883 family membrane-anchored ribosome-binding protein